MPYPEKYTRQYDFQSYQNSNPNRPLPGDKVNADLNQVGISITQIVDFIKKSIRSDGALMNGSVGYDQLSQSLQSAGLAPLSTWAPSVEYAKSRIVVNEGNLYQAKVTHTSGGSFEGDLANGNWTLIAELPQGIPGPAATVEVGSTVTLAPGDPATVDNVGDEHAAVLNFGIPQGIPGEDGDDGAAATIAVGAVTTLPAGQPVTVTNVGTSSAAVFDFAIPQGVAGANGADGADGANGADGADGVGVPVGGTTGQVLAKNSNADFDTEWVDQTAGGSGSSGIVKSTNVIEFPYFNRGQWSREGGASDVVGERTSVQVAGAPQYWFDHRALQLSSVTGTVSSTHPTNIGIDPSQAYRVGVWGIDSGSGNVNVIVTPLDANGIAMTALTLPLTLSASVSTTVGEVATNINAVGGAAPAWPTGTVGARIAVQNTNTGTNKFLFSIYCIQSGQLPNTTFTKSNFGGGTHEGTWDGTNLFALSHTYNQLAKYDSDLNRVAVATTGSYPHDIVILGGDVWVVNYVGASVQQINRSTMAVTNTFTINGSRHGFGIATDGTDLYIGAGDPGLGETPAIIKFTVSGSSQSVLSTDVTGGGANIPVQVLAGSIWSIHQTNSQVKRINPSGGATIATINCNIDGIYGLGNDGTLIYAVGRLGVAVIDPASNTVVGTYKFRYIFSGQSNAKKDASGAMWGCAANGVFKLDHARKTLIEFTGRLGLPKWAAQTSSGMAVGMYAFPSLDLYQ